MKQTNNAIKFLLAQYRAIYKHALIKGVLSSSVLALGLAAGVANASAIDSVSGANAVQSGIFTKENKLAITGSIASGTGNTATTAVSFNKDITLQGSGHSIVSTSGDKNSGGLFIFSDDKKLTLNNSGTLTLGSSGGNNLLSLQVRFNKIDVDSSSKIEIYGGTSGGSTPSTILKANDIEIAGEVLLKGRSGGKTGNAFLSASDTITVKGNKAKISMENTSGDKAILGTRVYADAFKGKSPDVHGTNHTFTGGASLIADTKSGEGMEAGHGAQVWGSSLNMTDSNLAIKGQGAQIHIYDTQLLKNNTVITEDATLLVDPTEFIAEKSNESGKQETKYSHTNSNGKLLVSGGNLVVSGKLAFVRGGTLEIADTNLTAGNTTVSSDDENGMIVVGIAANIASGAGNTNNSTAINKSFYNTTNPTLKISSATLNNFLTSSSKTTTLDNAIFGVTSVGDNAGALKLLNGGRLTFSDIDNVVDLSKFDFTDASGAKPGVIVIDYKSGEGWETIGSGDNSSGIDEAEHKIAGDIIIHADNLQVSKALGDAAENVSLTAKNLTLGDTNSVGGDFKFKDAKAENLTVIGKDFKLANNISLQNITPRDATLDGENIAQDGFIKGSFTISGEKTLTVDGGIYTATGDITLHSGSLNVTNTKNANASTLVLENALTLNSDNTNNITVDGKITGPYNPLVDTAKPITKLDLTSGIVVSSTGTSGTTITAQSGGVITFDADNLNTLFDKHANQIKFAVKNNGMLEAIGNLNFAFSGAKNDITSKASMFGSISDGYIKADSLTVTHNISDATASDLKGYMYGFGFPGATFLLKDFTFNNIRESSTEADTYAYLNKSKFEISNSFSSSSKKVVLTQDSLSTGQTGNNGVQLVFKTSKPTDTGSINMTAQGASIALENSSSTTNGSSGAKILVEQGIWSASNVVFDIAGSSSTMQIGNKLQDSSASLNAKGLKMSNGNFDILSNGSAQFETFNITGGILDLHGSLAISGLSTPVEDSYGINLSNGTINVYKGGKLDFTTDAAAQSIAKLNEDGKTVDVQKGSANINLSQNGELRLNYKSGTSISDEQLTALKNGLFGKQTIDGFLNVGQASIGLEVKQDDKGAYVSWEDFSKYQDIKQDVTNESLKNAVVRGITGNGGVKGSVGSLQLAEGNTSSSISLVGDTALNNASTNGNKFAASYNGQALDLSVSNSSNLSLVGSGEAGKVTLSENSNLITSGKGTISLKEISGSSANATLDSITNVEGNVSLKSLDTVQGSSLNAQSLSVASNSDIQGALKIANDVSFKGITESSTLAGQAEIGGNLSSKQALEILGNTTVTKTTTLEKGGVVANNASLVSDVLELRDNAVLYVGHVDHEDSSKDSSGYVEINRLDLSQGGKIIADPSYGKQASVFVTNTLGKTTDISTAKGNQGGTLRGDVIAAQNSVIALGVAKDKETSVIQQINDRFLNKFTNANKSLDAENIGSIVYVAKAIDVTNDAKIVVDSTKSATSYEKAFAPTSYDASYAPKVNNHDVYLGQNSALIIDETAVDVKTSDNSRRAAINFDKDSASIYGDGGKILLAGSSFNKSKEFALFSAKGTDNVTVAAANSGDYILVESLNGLFSARYNQGEKIANVTLRFNNEIADQFFTDSSDVVRDTLMTYAADDHDWENADKVDHKKIRLTNGIAKGYKVVDGQLVDAKGQAVSNTTDFVTTDDPNVVYHAANNAFLNAHTHDQKSGRSAEVATRLAAFGGATSAAFAVGNSINDAIAGRMGVGAQYGELSFADNGQGAGLWVSPLYKNNESEGFKAQGINYGVDMDMYGLALGGDYTMANGLRVGLMFNVGSGDADGKQAAQGVKNDFDFYGFGAYAGYSMNKLSVIADLSYSVVDNEIVAQTAVDKIGAKLDSTALSLGVTAKYELAMNGLDIVPHAGLRYTRIDTDDFTLEGVDSGKFAHVDSADLNVFSIPVGVSISKDIVSGTWTIKPSFDLTLSGHFGDDEAEARTSWVNVDDLQTVTNTEMLDSFSYSATLGVAAKTGNFSLGLGANYTGSSNTDEFGLNATARFVF